MSETDDDTQSYFFNKDSDLIADKYLEDVFEPNPKPAVDLKWMSFDLGEVGGGTQIIVAHKAISDTEYYVMTLGNGPKIEMTSVGAVNKVIEEYKKKQMMDKALGKQASDKIEEDEDYENIKIRFFKLTFTEGKKYLVEEFITLEQITEVAGYFLQ